MHREADSKVKSNHAEDGHEICLRGMRRGAIQMGWPLRRLRRLEQPRGNRRCHAARVRIAFNGRYCRRAGAVAEATEIRRANADFNWIG